MNLYPTTVYYPILVWDGEQQGKADRLVWLSAGIEAPMLCVGQDIYMGAEAVEPIIYSRWDAISQAQVLVVEVGHSEGGWGGVDEWVGTRSLFQECADFANAIDLGFLFNGAVNAIYNEVSHVEQPTPSV